MPEVIGQIAAVSSKQLPSGLYHSFCVDDVWYRTGRDFTNVAKGYKVKFNFEENQYGMQVDVPSLKFKEGEAPPPQTNGAKAPYQKKSGYDPTEAKRREKYWADKEARDIENQKRISYQAATNTAIQLLNGAIANDCVAVPKGKNLGARFEAFQAMVDEEAERIFRIYQLVPENFDAVMGGTEEVVQTTSNDFDEEVKGTDLESHILEAEEAW